LPLALTLATGKHEAASAGPRARRVALIRVLCVSQVLAAPQEALRRFAPEGTITAAG